MQFQFVRLLLAPLVVLAVSGLVVAQEPESDLVDLILGLLAEDDNDIRGLAFEQIRREAPGVAATEKFAAHLAQLGSDAQVGLLSALGDRGDAAAKPAILKLLESAPALEVQVATWNAIGKLGNATDCGALVKQLSADAASLRQVARSSLVQLSGAGVTEALLAEFKNVPLAEKVVIIEILTARRDLSIKSQLLTWSVVATPAVRQAAMASLGQLGSTQDLPDMLPGVLKASRGAERDAAEKCVMRVAQREADVEARAQPILLAMRAMSAKDQTLLLPTLGRVGGKAALEEVESAIRSSDTAAHSAGIIALANWPDASVASNLIHLIKTDKHASHGIIALRALIRIAPLPDGRTEQEKLELLKTAMQMCSRDEERKLALQRASAIRLPETLRFVLPYVDQPHYAEQACATVVQLAHDRKLRDDHKPEFHLALDKVLATSKDATVLERADRYKKGQTWVRPKPSY